jgi:hypothetical protein
MGSNQTEHYIAEEERDCICGARFQLICKMLDPRNGRIHRMFKCDCGKRAWDEQRPEAAGPSGSPENTSKSPSL